MPIDINADNLLSLPLSSYLGLVETQPIILLEALVHVHTPMYSQPSCMAACYALQMGVVFL